MYPTCVSSKGGELLIRPLVDGDGLSSLGEKGKVRTFVAVKFFYIADEEPTPWKAYKNDFAINSDFHILLLLKDQTYHYYN